MQHDSTLSRRAFLAATTTSALAVAYAQPNTAAVVPGKVSPNETVVVGMIGLGGRCHGMVATGLGTPGMRIAAVCDCFRPRVDSFLKNGADKGQQWNGYLDFREMFEKENLDGVMVETTTHARAWIACYAMAAGLDAYIEKPMCLTIAEGREMVNIARKYGCVTQVGTQQRSIPLNNWASDLVQNGALGKVTEVLAPDFVAPLRWTAKEGEPMPEGGTEGWWDVWTNQVEMRPYHHDLHRGWSTWWDYDGGGRSFGVTGWGTHSYDQIQRGLGTSATGPVEVVLEEPVADRPAGTYEERTISESETGAPYYQMVKNLTGPRAKVTMTYANGTKLNLSLDADRSPGLGCIFVGEKGRIEINRDQISADPAELVAGSDRPPHLSVPETQPHIENWLECIKTRKTCNADIEYGQRSTTLCYLVNIVRDIGRVGEPLKWDPETERFTNCDEANAMLSRPRRAGYELPA